jgi:release factor glutamine methyltransferase
MTTLAATLAATLTDAALRLEGSSDSPRLDAEVLLAHALRRERSHLHAHADAQLETEPAREFARLVAARMRGEPIAYLTGKREFWSLELQVTPDTLIPRPETELLVERVLTLIPTDAAVEILDLGTGSGAIALAIARERPRSRVTALDLSTKALQVARANAAAAGIANVEFLQGAWFAPAAGRCFQVIVSNPPYVSDTDPHLGMGDLRFEPKAALAAGPDGLRDLREIIAGAPAHLYRGGVLLLEHGLDQGEAVRALLRARGFSQVSTHRDLSGHERASSGYWVNPPGSG